MLPLATLSLQTGPTLKLGHSSPSPSPRSIFCRHTIEKMLKIQRVGCLNLNPLNPPPLWVRQYPDKFIRDDVVSLFSFFLLSLHLSRLQLCVLSVSEDRRSQSSRHSRSPAADKSPIGCSSKTQTDRHSNGRTTALQVLQRGKVRKGQCRLREQPALTREFTMDGFALHSSSSSRSSSRFV